VVYYLRGFELINQFIQDADDTFLAYEAFTLLGLLANYNKFESQNPYRLRLEDFVNEATIQKVIRAIGQESAELRSAYVEIQEDLPEGWTLSSTLSMIGLGKIAPGAKAATPTIDPETAKEMFLKLYVVLSCH
jgi:hypothetical protein